MKGQRDVPDTLPKEERVVTGAIDPMEDFSRIIGDQTAHLSQRIKVGLAAILTCLPII